MAGDPGEQDYRRYRFLYHKATNYIPMDELENDALYWIVARNAHVGIWRERSKGFLIPRVKFDRKYLFVEYHRDTQDDETFPFGTAKPFERLDKAPFALDPLFQPHSGKEPYTERLEKEEGTFYGSVLKYLLDKAEEFPEEGFLTKYGRGHRIEN